jgi:hypothetical protein
MSTTDTAYDSLPSILKNGFTPAEVNKAFAEGKVTPEQVIIAVIRRRNAHTLDNTEICTLIAGGALTATQGAVALSTGVVGTGARWEVGDKGTVNAKGVKGSTRRGHWFYLEEADAFLGDSDDAKQLRADYARFRDENLAVIQSRATARREELRVEREAAKAAAEAAKAAA